MPLRYIDVDGLYEEYGRTGKDIVERAEFEEALKKHMLLFRSLIVRAQPIKNLGRQMNNVGSILRSFYSKGEVYNLDDRGSQWTEKYLWLHGIDVARYDPEADIVKCWGYAAFSSKPRNQLTDTAERAAALLDCIETCLADVVTVKPRDVTRLFPRSLKHRNQMARVLRIEPTLETAERGFGLCGKTWYEVVTSLCSDVATWRIGTDGTNVTISDGFHIVAGTQKEHK